MTQSADNVLLQEVIAWPSGYVEDSGIIKSYSESESDIPKRITENSPKWSSFITAIGGCIPT